MSWDFTGYDADAARIACRPPNRGLPWQREVRVGSHPTLISSVQRALHLIDEVGAAGTPLSAKSLSRRTGLALPTTYHLLQTLVHEGYLRRVDHLYVLGERLLTLGDPAGAAARTARVQPALARLHEELHAAAYLAVLQDGEILVPQVVDSGEAPRVDEWVDFRLAGHATALGKAILGTLGAAERRDYLTRHELADLTAHTITDPRVLARCLGGAAGLAVDREEYVLGTCCVAAAVPLAGTVAAVAVSVPATRLSAVVAAPSPVRRAAGRIALALAPSA